MFLRRVEQRVQNKILDETEALIGKRLDANVYYVFFDDGKQLMNSNGLPAVKTLSYEELKEAFYRGEYQFSLS